jgi:hypothetical protein
VAVVGLLVLLQVMVLVGDRLLRPVIVDIGLKLVMVAMLLMVLQV